MTVNKKILVVAGLLVLAGGAMSHRAEAAGCLRGAVAGGVVGHYAGHHGLLGAGVGCIYEHHAAARRERETERRQHSW
jgi:hypothetical protein